MDRHESRDLDGVIDDVARAMTGAELGRDLRPAVASRIADASWTRFGQTRWRAGLAAAGLAAVVLVAVVLRPAPAPPRLQTVAGGGATHAPVVAPVAVEDQAQAIPRAARVVTRQTIDDTPVIEETVAISALEIVPFEESDAPVLWVPQRVEIAPIDVELVTIGELEQVE